MPAKVLLLLLGALGMTGCTGIPPGVEPVRGFDSGRYLGRWYEIARLDHSFERGLTRVRATYTPRSDGGIDVLNEGFSPASGEWKKARGKAYFIDGPDVGRLKVSFFGPFYGAYNVIALDEEGYSYSMVCGPRNTYLWILSRSPRMEDTALERLVGVASSLGFDTSKLIFVDHDDDVKERP